MKINYVMKKIFIIFRCFYNVEKADGKDMDKIVLYGAGLLAEKFYAQNKDNYKIMFVIDQSVEKFHNMDVYKLEKVKDKLKALFIVVTASRDNYKTIKNNLEAIGLNEFNDFTWVNHFNKKQVIIYGNCHMSKIKEYLEIQPEFIRKYYISYYRIGDETEEEYPGEKQLANCDVFITQDIRNNNSRNVPGYKELVGKLRENTEVVVVPNLYGVNLFYPQLNGTQDNNIIKEKHLKEIGNPSLDCYEIVDALSSNRDNNIELMFSEGKSKDEIISILERPDYYKEDMILSMFEKEMQKIEEREKDCSFTISDWIKDNYKQKQLFYEPKHPTNALLIEIAKRCMRTLDIHIDENITITVGMDAREIFIYNSVKKILGLKYNIKYIRKFATYGTLEEKPMNFCEYINYYYQWIIDVMENNM